MSTMITDDEVVGAAATLGVSWPLGLTTVDLRDRREVERAILRGYRSMLVRGLASVHDGVVTLDPEFERVFRAVAEATNSVQVLIGRLSEPLLSAAPFVSFHESGTNDPVLAASSPSGLVDLTTVDGTTARRTVSRVCEQAVAAGVGTSSEASELALFRVSFGPDRNEAVEVTRGRVRRAELASAVLPAEPLGWESCGVSVLADAV